MIFFDDGRRAGVAGIRVDNGLSVGGDTGGKCSCTHAIWCGVGDGEDFAGQAAGKEGEENTGAFIGEFLEKRNCIIIDEPIGACELTVECHPVIFDGADGAAGIFAICFVNGVEFHQDVFAGQ